MSSYYVSAASDATWSTWATTSANCTSTSDSACWYTWTDTGSTSTSSETTWTSWNTDGYTIYPSYQTAPKTQEELEHQRIQAQQQAEERMQREAERETLRQAAELKANELLQDLIGEEQLKVYLETGRLLVKGKRNDYLLEKTGRVTRVEKDKLVDLCIHIADRLSVPQTDNVVALKLMAEADDYAFDKMANVRGTRPLEALPMAACG
jgi:hypothetical protein